MADFSKNTGYTKYWKKGIFQNALFENSPISLLNNDSGYITITEFNSLTGSLVREDEFNSYTSSIETDIREISSSLEDYAKLKGGNLFVGNQTIQGDLTLLDLEVQGTASFNVLVTTYESSSIIYSSGSTKFGDTIDDTHQFTGSISLSGSNVDFTQSTGVSGSFSGSFVGDGSQLTGISNSNIGNSDLTITSTGTRKLILGGTSATDYLTIRNSGDSLDYFKIQGNGPVTVGNSSGGNFSIGETGGGATYAMLYLKSNTSNHLIQAYNTGLDIYAAGGLAIYAASQVVANFGTSGLYMYGGKDITITPSSKYIISGAGAHKMVLGGSLSTDSFTIRNSGDTLDIFKVRGGGSIECMGLTNNSTNVILGLGSADAFTSGVDSVSIGYNALTTNTTANRFVAIGTSALQNANGGFGYSTAVGYGALADVTSGMQNVGVGYNAGRGITTGEYNTILGTVTGLSSTLSNNVIISDGLGNVAIWKNSGNLIGFGYNPTSDTLGAKVDIKAQGALSTDIAFRVRNSVNNDTIFQITGDKKVYGIFDDLYQNNDGGNPRIVQRGSYSWFEIKSTAYSNADELLKSATTVGKIAWPNTTDQHKLNFVTPSSYWGDDGKYYAGFHWYKSGISGDPNVTGINAWVTEANRQMWLTPDNSLLLYNNSTGIEYTGSTNSFQMYSADITSSNAAPHFRTEAGDIIKLYKEIQPALSGSANTGDPTTDALIEAMKTIILNLGFGSSS